jgi:hypothetical protein
MLYIWDAHKATDEDTALILVHMDLRDGVEVVAVRLDQGIDSIPLNFTLKDIVHGYI